MHTGIVSDHFSWLEVEHSQTAERLGLNNDVPAYLEKTVLRTAAFMEQVRSLLGLLNNKGYARGLTDKQGNPI
jgi:hypothetical protein